MRVIRFFTVDDGACCRVQVATVVFGYPLVDEGGPFSFAHWCGVLHDLVS